MLGAVQPFLLGATIRFTAGSHGGSSFSLKYLLLLLLLLLLWLFANIAGGKEAEGVWE